MDQGLREVAERPGLVVLLGSGETLPGGRRVFGWLVPDTPEGPRLGPVHREVA